jgi:hypothetical protein
MVVEPSRRAREQQGGGRETVAQLGPPTALRKLRRWWRNQLHDTSEDRAPTRLEVPAFDTDPRLPKGRGLSERQQLHRVHVLYLGTKA